MSCLTLRLIDRVPTGSTIAKSGSRNKIRCRGEIAVALPLECDRTLIPLLGTLVGSKEHCFASKLRGLIALCVPTRLLIAY